MTAFVPSRRRILWSGGFDSTALVLEGLARGDRIEPVYIDHDNGWKKDRYQMAAIARVIVALPEGLRARLTPVQRVTLEDVYRDTMARLAELDAAAIELGVGRSPQVALLHAVGRAVGPIEAAYVANDTAGAQLPLSRELLLSGGIQMPLIRTSKLELWAAARDRGFEDLLRLTWSCEGPAGEPDWPEWPCGRCDPCRHRLVPHPK